MCKFFFKKLVFYFLSFMGFYKQCLLLWISYIIGHTQLILQYSVESWRYSLESLAENEYSRYWIMNSTKFLIKLNQLLGTQRSVLIYSVDFSQITNFFKSGTNFLIVRECCPISLCFSLETISRRVPGYSSLTNSHNSPTPIRP